MIRHRTRRWAVGLLAAAMALTIALPGAAFAAGGNAGWNTTENQLIGLPNRDGKENPADDTAASAHWTVPTKPMDNTVTRNGKTYKVVTTWAMAWSTSGPDYLGISNSSFYGNGGNGNANVTNSTLGSQNSMLGVWASEANESPNAYNWNAFYNLYASEQRDAGVSMVDSDQAAVRDTSWDTSAGVWGPFKYRPEIIWLCNNLNANGVASNVSLINKGQYYADSKGVTIEKAGQNTTGVVILDDTATAATGADKNTFAVDGDDKYNPYVVQPVCANPYTFVAVSYRLADFAQKVIDDTAGNGQLASGTTINWKNINSLPRATRYEASAKDCALSFEQLARGSVYYTLSELAKGTDTRKKVAYVSANPGATADGVTLDASHAAVAVFDYTDSIGPDGAMNGTASWSPLVVDQLGQDGKLDVISDHTYLGPAAGTDPDNVTNPSMTYSLYKASADDLASCDVILCNRSDTKTVNDWREFIKTNATTDANKAKADTITIVNGFPFVCNGSNYTMDKGIYGAFALDCIYPKLFPNMENSTFWYKNIYHIKTQYLNTAMTWAFGVATLPASQSVIGANDSYNVNATVAKYNAGLQYYLDNKGKDATLSRVIANKALDGSTTNKGNDKNPAGPNVYANFEPSTYWIQKTGLTASPSRSDQTVTGTASYTKTYGNAPFKLNVASSVGAPLTYQVISGADKVSVKDGTVTILKAGSAVVRVTAQATDDFNSATKDITIKVNKAANTPTFKGKTAKVSYKTLKKKNVGLAVSKVITIKNNHGTAKFTKTSGNSKITVNSKTGKVTVKKGLAKKTYTVKVKVKYAASTNYVASKEKTVNFKVKVK